MVRENRVKDYTFPSTAITGSAMTFGYSDHVLNGKILRVTIQNPSSPGSLWIKESGTNVEFFRKNDITSGATTLDYYPVAYTVNQNAVTGSPSNYAMMVANSIFVLAGSGLTSGTGTNFGPVKISYI